MSDEFEQSEHCTFCKERLSFLSKYLYLNTWERHEKSLDVHTLNNESEKYFCDTLCLREWVNRSLPIKN